jgi:hypothetical protein
MTKAEALRQAQPTLLKREKWQASTTARAVMTTEGTAVIGK